MGQPGSLDRVIDLEVFERFFENLPPAGEVAAHNRVFGVNLVEGPTLIFNARTEERRGELIFHLFDAITIASRKKSDHAIGKH
jgi:hypothetical protein